MQNKDREEIVRAFGIKRTRQLMAVALAMTAAILVAVVSKYPGLFGGFSKKDLLILLVVIILIFINFSSYNWRCPSCNKYLGSDIAQTKCRKCKTRLR